MLSTWLFVLVRHASSLISVPRTDGHVCGLIDSVFASLLLSR